MKTNNQETPARLDRVSTILLIIPIIAALCLVFLFYLPGINRAVSDNQLPKEVLSLKLHIAAYSLSYGLFIAGLLLTIKHLFAQTMIPRSWIEGTASIATLLAFLGLVFGIPASKQMWNGIFVWDIKLISAICATIVFVGISIAVFMTRFISGEMSRNAALLFLFLTAVVLCFDLFLIGRVFGRTIHPQWFPELLFR
jgi:ABC-type transport system involved in cytochrome c biogenesis permease subunit